MKKRLVVVGLFLIPMVCAVKSARADGSTISPALVTSSMTNQGYLYSVIPSSWVPGGVLANNSGGILAWSDTPVVSTNAFSVMQAVALPSFTLKQLQAITPAVAGQLAICSNCTNTNLVVSSGTTQGAWAAVSSTGTAGANTGTVQ